MASVETIQKALQYRHEKGWNIIPVYKDSKRPALNEGEFEQAFEQPLPETRLLEALSKNDVNNIGLITGKTSQLCIIDLDPDNMPDQSRIDFYRTHYPTGLIQRTPSGGYHLFYKLPQGMALPNRDLEAGVQLFGAPHNVVIAPSYVKAKRGNREYEGQYEWIKYGEPADFPVDVLNLQSNKTTSFVADEALEALEYALEHGAFPAGAHNDTIYRASLVLASRGTPDSVILGMMKMLDRNDPSPQGEKAVEGAVRRACEVAAKNVINPTPSRVQVEDILDKPDTLRKQDDVFEAVSYSMLTQEYADYETRWLIQDWLIDQSIMMISAPPQRYKTWIAADMALSIMSGCPFLGEYTVYRTGNVLFIQQEDFGPNLIKRFNLIERGKIANCSPEVELRETDSGLTVVNKYNKNGNEIFFHTRSQLSFDNLESIVKMYNVAMEIKPVLIVIDPFYSLSVKDDYYKGAANVIQSVIKEIRRRTGSAFLFVHHTRKGNDKEGDPTGRQAAWGSQFLNAAVEGMINIARPSDAPDNVVMAYPNFKDEQAPQPVKLTFQINKHAEQDRDAYRVDISHETMDAKEAMIKEYLLENGATTLNDLFEEFEDVFGAKSRLSEFLKKCQGIVKVKRGTYALAPDAILNI